MTMVKVEDVVVTRSGRVPTKLIEQVPAGFIELTMILPVVGLTVIKGSIVEAEQVQVFDRVPQFTVAENGVMSNCPP